MISPISLLKCAFLLYICKSSITILGHLVSREVFSSFRSDSVKGRLWFLQIRPRRPECIPMGSIIYLEWDFYIYIYVSMPIPMLIPLKYMIWERGMGQDGVNVNTRFFAYLLWSGWSLHLRVPDVTYRLISRGSWLPAWCSWCLIVDWRLHVAWLGWSWCGGLVHAPI